MIRRLLPACALLGLLAGCATSTPMHYYTLMAPASADSTAGGQAPFQFELLPVDVPAQVDLPQLVIRGAGPGIAPVEGQRWIAPLPQELRGALSADLARAWGTQDVTGLPATGRPRLRVKLDVRRFDSVPGQYALLDAAWSVHGLDSDRTLACTSTLREPVGPGYDALVQGHQRAIAELAAKIASVAPALQACPAP